MALFFNLPVLLMSKAFDTERGDTRRDTLRNSFLASMINSPAVGLAVAAMLAKRSAPEALPPPPVTAPASTTGGATGGAGGLPTPPAIGSILGQIIPHDFFPSFIGYTWRQALELAHLASLVPHPLGDSKGLVVVHQHPNPGDEWPKGITAVTLTFGSRDAGAN